MASSDSTAALDAALARWAQEPGGLLPALHEVQSLFGWISPDAVVQAAAAFNLSRAEVHGVVTYYTHFRRQPAGRHVVQVCRAEACQAMGADALLAHAQQRLGCGLHASSADGRYTLEPVFCLGLCASSPSARVGDQLHARLTPEIFDQVITALEATS